MPSLPPAPENSIPQGDHILVVDDEPELAESVANLLKENGYQVEITHSAEEAWESLCKRQPILIITDDVMPGASGEELFIWLGDSLQMYEIPIIALGNSFARPTMTTCWGKHFDMYLTKPFNPEELLSFVRRILQPSDGNPRIQI